MFLVMSLMTAKIGRDRAEDGAITPRCGSELKLGSGDKASRGWGMRGMVAGIRACAFTLFKGGDGANGANGADGADGVGFGANFRGGAVVVNDDLFTF